MNPEQRIAKQEAELAEKDAQLAARDARNAELVAENAELRAQVEKLTKKFDALSERLGQNSSNSDRPPSSDSPKARGERGKGKDKGKSKGKKGGKSGSGRKRGGQKGHAGSHRELVPESQVTHIEHLFPKSCENCHNPLPEKHDPNAKRYQQTEVPPATVITTEWRRHSGCCDGCGHRTWAPYDSSRIPSSRFGPRLMALIVLLTGAYHLSRRRTGSLLAEMVGVKVSLGAISAVEARASKAVAPAVDEAWEKAVNADIKHTDGTGWLLNSKHCSLWTIATAACTVFKIVSDSSKASLKSLFKIYHGILVSDRAKALNFWVMKNRQICWAHLLRKFISFAEKKGKGGELGRELLDCTGILFHYWHSFKDNKITAADFGKVMVPLRAQIEDALERGRDANIPGLSGSCRDILVHRAALWNYVDHLGLADPTNNHAERELRAFVLWRKRSYGTQSERGNRYAERIMTVAHTARKQGLDLLDFLVASCKAQLAGEAGPSLFSAAD